MPLGLLFIYFGLKRFRCKLVLLNMKPIVFKLIRVPVEFPLILLAQLQNDVVSRPYFYIFTSFESQTCRFLNLWTFFENLEAYFEFKMIFDFEINSIIPYQITKYNSSLDIIQPNSSGTCDIAARLSK